MLKAIAIKKWKLIQLAFVVFILCMTSWLFLFSASDQPGESILKQIQGMQQRGENLEAVEKVLGKSSRFSMASSCGTNPPRLRFNTSRSWYFFCNISPVSCEVVMLTVYAYGDGEIVDVDLQKQRLTGMDAWKCLWYRAKGDSVKALDSVKLESKSPL